MLEKYIDKDGKHEEEVNAAGGLFFPLIVETLGLWTPNSLRIIKLIVSKAASINGWNSVTSSSKKPSSFIRLWVSNARMLLSISSVVRLVLWTLIPIKLICLLLLLWPVGPSL